MNVKLLVAAVVVGVAVVSSAFAAPPAGKGKPSTTGAGCKPRIAVVLKGVLASTPGASATSISVNVKSGNRWGRAYVNAAQPTTIKVGADTKVRRQGGKTLGDLLAGDRVLVQSRVCKADLANDARPELIASKVIAHPARAAKDDKDDKNDD